MSPKSSGTWGRCKLKACLVFLVIPCFREREGERGEKGTGREEGAKVKLVNVGIEQENTPLFSGVWPLLS